jgi:N-acyl-D-amino-acid deacylase
MTHSTLARPLQPRLLPARLQGCRFSPTASSPHFLKEGLARLFAGLGLLLMVACTETPSNGKPPAAASRSTIIQNAMIVDGSGSTPYLGSMRIEGQRIKAVGALDALPGEPIIDASGLTLAPGFIDTHSHHDRGLKTAKDAVPLLTQGITTAVFGQDGDSHYPIKTFFDHYDAFPAAINVASYVGHNTLRAHAMQERQKEVADDKDIERMRANLAEELAEGALGLSTGLEYEPGLYSSKAEVLTLAEDTAALGGRYISHIRSEDRFLWDAIDEVIDIGRQTGMPVQISHVKLAAKGLWGQSEKLLARLDEARASGVQITADVYPYEYWQSTMWVLLPDRDPDNLAEIAFVLEELTPADGIIFMAFEPNPDYVNRSVAEIAELRGTTPVQTFSDLLKEAAAWSDAHEGRPAETIVGRSMSEADIRSLLTWPHSNVCSDGGYTGHPRGHGTFPLILARYVREEGLMTLAQAVQAMTSRAAAHLGISNRGLLAPGYQADLVLFDAEIVQDHATVRDGQKRSTGVSQVWVNGEIVLSDGRPTGVLSGDVIRRH